jgi:hypothetical protein
MTHLPEALISCRGGEFSPHLRSCLEMMMDEAGADHGFHDEKTSNVHFFTQYSV